jgi:hypothetical protein
MPALIFLQPCGLMDLQIEMPWRKSHRLRLATVKAGQIFLVAYWWNASNRIWAMVV